MADLTQGAIEAIQKPVQLAESLTKAVQIINHPDPRKQLLVQSGKFTEIDIPPTYRNHSVESMADLIRYAESPAAVKSVVWHSVDAVVLVLDDEDRRERVTLSLEYSAAWEKLTQLDKGGVLTQKQFCTLLKNYLGVPQASIQIFKRLDFQSLIRASGEIAKGRESLGRSIETSVNAAADLPEELMVTVPIYITLGEKQTYDVRLLLDYDGQNAQIQVQPEPDLLQEIADKHQADIQERLKAALPDVPVYQGSL